MAEIHRNPQKQRRRRSRSRSLCRRFGFIFTKSPLEKPVEAEHKDEHMAAFELYDEGSINNNNSSGDASPSPSLPISSSDLYSWPAGSKTPPLNSFCSVPFKWEEAPGKAKHRPADDQLISSYETQDGFCRWDYDYDEESDLNVFKVAEGKLVAFYAATPTYHNGGNDRITQTSRRRPILRKLFGGLLGRLRSAIDSARRIWSCKFNPATG